MTPAQFKIIKELIEREAKQALEQFMQAEIKEHPEHKEFLASVQESEFFCKFFERGFTEGIVWERKHKHDKFIL